MKIKMTFIAVLFAVLSACSGDDSGAAKDSALTSDAVVSSDSSSADSSTVDMSKFDVEKAKEQALLACDAQTDQVPAEMKEQVKSMCKCSIENTDFEKIAELTEAGDTDEIMSLTMESAKKCMEL